MSDQDTSNSKGDPFGGPEHCAKLRVDGNDLYWNNRKVKLEGWSRSEKLTAVSLVVAASTAIILSIANWEKIKPVLCDLRKFEFCITLSNDSRID